MFLSTRCENSNQNNLHISDRQNAMSINGSARSDEFWRKKYCTGSYKKMLQNAGKVTLKLIVLINQLIDHFWMI